MNKSSMGIVFLGVLSGCIYAESVIADRPGFSTGTYSVHPGKFNIEMGYNYTFDKTSTKNDTQDFPLFELRTGITEDIEFDLLWDGWSYTKDGVKEHSSDMTIGGKYRVLKEDMYNITFMVLVTLPTGSQSDFQTQNISPLIGLLWDYTIDESISLFGTIQSSTYKEQKRIYDLQTAIGVTWNHTENFASFIEAYSILPSSSSISKEYVVDGGFTYLIQENIQLDINGGIGLNRESNNFLGAGIAVTF